MEKNSTDLAVKMADLEAARDRLEILLDVKMGGHDSSYWNLYYSTLGGDLPDISVYTNRRTGEKGDPLTEKDYENFPLLISIYNAPSVAALNSIIDKVLSDPKLGAVLIRKIVWDKEGNRVEEIDNTVKPNP